MKLYHATPMGNVESILNGGLKPNGSGIVYLSKKPDSWRGEGMTVLEIDTDGVDVRMTTFGYENLDEVLYWGEVPASRITVYNEAAKEEQ